MLGGIIMRHEQQLAARESAAEENRRRACTTDTPIPYQEVKIEVSRLSAADKLRLFKVLAKALDYDVEV